MLLYRTLFCLYVCVFHWQTVLSFSDHVYKCCSVTMFQYAGNRLLIMFRIRHSQAWLWPSVCVCLCVWCCCIPTLWHAPGCNLGDGRGCSSCALLGGFAIGAWISLLWQHMHLMRMPTSAFVLALWLVHSDEYDTVIWCPWVKLSTLWVKSKCWHFNQMRLICMLLEVLCHLFCHMTATEIEVFLSCHVDVAVLVVSGNAWQMLLH